MPMSVCYCGQPWSPGQQFCTGCGTPLPESEAQPQAGEPTPTPKNVRMIRANNWVMWVLFAVSLMAFWLCGIAIGAGSPGTESSPETRVQVAPTISIEQVVATAEPVPTRSVDVVAAMAVPTMMDYPRVRDAAVSQDGKTLSLVLVVDYAIDPSYAQQLGDNFVRLTKTLLLDGETPGERIGKGEYDYIIGVYYANEKPLVMGAKARTADRISW